MKPHAGLTGGQMGLLRLAAAQVGMDWKDLKARAGVKSSKEITNAVCDELMEHLKKCGFVYQPRVKGRPQPSKVQRNRQLYLDAIGVALGALGKNWDYAEGIAKQMFKLERVVWQWLSPEKIHKVQIALINQERREAGDPPQPRPETIARRRIRTQRRKDAKAQELEASHFEE